MSFVFLKVSPENWGVVVKDEKRANKSTACSAKKCSKSAEWLVKGDSGFTLVCNTHFINYYKVHEKKYRQDKMDWNLRYKKRYELDLRRNSHECSGADGWRQRSKEEDCNCKREVLRITKWLQECENYFIRIKAEIARVAGKELNGIELLEAEE